MPAHGGQSSGDDREAVLGAFIDSALGQPSIQLPAIFHGRNFELGRFPYYDDLVCSFATFLQTKMVWIFNSNRGNDNTLRFSESGRAIMDDSTKRSALLRTFLAAYDAGP